MANTLEILIKAKDEASGTVTNINSKLQNMAPQLKKIGLAATVAGAAITGALALATKAAAEEEAGIIRLSTAMKAVGLSYEDTKDDLEAWIDGMQQATAFADSDMRDALSNLIRMTRDTAKAQEYLGLAMDIARGTGRDLESSVTLISYALSGNYGMLTRVLPSLKDFIAAQGDAIDTGKVLAEAQRLFAGQAEAYGGSVAGQFELIKNNMGDVMEMIGGTVLPLLSDLFNKHINPLIQSLKAWADEHPELLKNIVMVVGAIGGLLAVLGPVLVFIGMIAPALPVLGAAFAVLTGPVGLVIAAIAALIAIGVLIWQNWDTIKAKAIEIWDAIAGFFSNIWEKIVGFFSKNWDKILAILFPAVGIPILIARNWDTIADFFKDLWKRVTDIISSWWDNIKSFLENMNPWTWIKKGWEEMQEGIKGVLHNIFGSGFVSEWTEDLTNHLANVDLSGAGEAMFGTLQEGIGDKLDEISGIVKDWAGDIGGAIGGGGVPPKPVTTSIEAGLSQMRAMVEQYIAWAGAGGHEREEHETRYADTLRMLDAFFREMWEGKYPTTTGITTDKLIEIINQLKERVKTLPPPWPFSSSGMITTANTDILPNGNVGSVVNITFSEPVFMENEASIKKIADKVYEKIKEEQRFSFGRAYSG